MKFIAVTSISLILVLSGCAVDRYQTALPHLSDVAVIKSNIDVVVLLQPVFPDKPLTETVADNEIGVFWSPEESHHIGFTQHYASTLSKNAPQLAMLTALPANQRIGMSASGDIKPFNIDSRILVPFGRFIHDNVAEAVGSNGAICENEICVRQAIEQHPGAELISVQFTKLRVTEQTRNMLLLEVEGTATVTRSGSKSVVRKIQSQLSRSITSEGMWHSDFLKAMNNIANESTSAVVANIFSEEI
jgi:hypothetical protein